MTGSIRRRPDRYVAKYKLKSEYPARSVDQKIDRYEDVVKGWYLNIAEALKYDPSDPECGPGADFVSLLILMSFFEAHGILLQGTEWKFLNRTDKKTRKKTRDSNSAANFQIGFLRFLSIRFSDIPSATHDDIAFTIYKKVRCGLYHQGRTKRGIRLYRGEDDNHPTPPIQVRFYQGRPATFVFNVPALVTEVQNYLNAYLSDLRDRKTVHMTLVNGKLKEMRKSFAEGWVILRELAEEK